MKSRNLLIGISCILASIMLLYACQKNISPSISTPSLTASTTDAAVGQQVTLNVINPPPGSHLMWSSTSPDRASFAANGTASANVSFTVPGTYTVTCYFVSGAAADSFPTNDSVHNPYDTVPNYPTYPPVYDTTGYPHDSVPSYPDTVANYPHDTIPNYPHDTTTNYPHDTTTNYPHDTVPGYPHDTVPNFPHDTTHSPTDSTMHNTNGRIISSVTIIITVH